MREVEHDDKWDDSDGPDTVEYGPETESDPFAPGNVEIITAITLLRIYDVLMAQLTLDHPALARNLAELHERGGIKGANVKFDPEA